MNFNKAFPKLKHIFSDLMIILCAMLHSVAALGTNMIAQMYTLEQAAVYSLCFWVYLKSSIQDWL